MAFINNNYSAAIEVSSIIAQTHGKIFFTVSSPENQQLKDQIFRTSKNLFDDLRGSIYYPLEDLEDLVKRFNNYLSLLSKYIELESTSIDDSLKDLYRKLLTIDITEFYE